MTEVAETTLGELRKMVDADPADDVCMTQFVIACMGYRNRAIVRITITDAVVTYRLDEPDE